MIAMIKRSALTKKKRPLKRYLAPGSTVLTDVIRIGTVVSVYGEDVVLHYGHPDWPFPTREVRKLTEVVVMDLVPEQHYEEAPL